MLLIRTLIDEGYTEEDLKSLRTSNMVVNACEAPEGASSRSSGKIRKSKQITASNLKFVLTEFFRGPFSAHTLESKNTTVSSLKQTTFEEIKKEKPIEIDPKDRIKMDTSDMAQAELDLDFLSELGVAEEFADKKDE